MQDDVDLMISHAYAFSDVDFQIRMRMLNAEPD